MAKSKPEVIPQKEESPLRKAFSIEKGSGGWSLVTYSMRNDKVEDVSRTEPDLKIVALEKFKIASFHYWSSIG